MRCPGHGGKKCDTPVSMVILLHLADSANDLDGKTYYSLSAIGNRCRCHRTTVIRQLKILEEQGYITLTKRATVGKSGNVYRVNYHLSEEARKELEYESAEDTDPSQSATSHGPVNNPQVIAESD